MWSLVGRDVEGKKSVQRGCYCLLSCWCWGNGHYFSIIHNENFLYCFWRILSQEPLHSAVMLEQAAYCYLLSKPPMLHKYGFHLVLSGDRYKKCDQVAISQVIKRLACELLHLLIFCPVLPYTLQIKHAIRTYRSAMSVYKGTTWSHIKDHIHFHLGQ